MNVTHPSPPAAHRAQRSGLLALAGAALMIVGIALLAADLTWGLVPALLGFGAGYAFMSHHLALTELRDVGDVPVHAIAEEASVLRPTMTSTELLTRLSVREDVDHHLVRGEDGWQAVPKGVLLQHALNTDEQIPVHLLGRPAGHVPEDLPVDRMPRPPRADEVLIVREGRRPLVLTHDSLLMPAERRREAARTLRIEHDLTGTVRPGLAARNSTDGIHA